MVKTRDGVVIGRGRGKSTPKQRVSRVKKKSLRQRESEEYMSAYESLTDIVITNGSTTDVMQKYEDSILEDDAFKPPGDGASNDVIMPRRMLLWSTRTRRLLQVVVLEH
jgi:hypothetical protein